ncbi:MAG: type II toxin-antitoxin system RelE/ParE family toxin [Steroidobacterales bacterium]
MAWRIDFADSAAKQLRKLDPSIALRITNFLRERFGEAVDPRTLGAALGGDELGQFWKYRVGDYRIVAEIRDREIRILVVRVGHRRDVYR